MLAMVAYIKFEANDRRQAFEIRRISKCKIDTSWKNLTDKAEIELPRNIKLPLLNDGTPTDIKQWIRRGDVVQIKLGYNNTYHDEFTGFVSDVEADIPIKIQCEDYMWKLKQLGAKYASKRTKISDLLKAIIPDELGINIDTADATIGAFRTKKGENVAQVLSRLKSMGIYSYFKGSTLVSGKIYTDDDSVVNYDFSQNIISNQLKYLVSDDVKIKVTATSTLSNGNKLQVSVGDKDGQEQRLSYFNISNIEELKQKADEDLKRLKVDGYKGSFQTFGFPFISHGYTVNLVDKDYPERAGKYKIQQVVTSFSDSGYRREVKIDRQA
jgi:phage protein D